MSYVSIQVGLVGFATGLSLIVAIGSQNAFVLRQGLRREHIWSVVLVCVLSDVILIFAGIAGLGAAVRAVPVVVTVVRLAGVVFLVGYGVLALRRAARPGVLRPAADECGGLSRTLLTTAALTFLNPHVYLDTVVLLGALGNQHGAGRWVFGGGAALASLVWFCALGLGAGRLVKVFARPTAWRILDGIIGVVMLVLAVRLALA